MSREWWVHGVCVPFIYREQRTVLITEKKEWIYRDVSFSFFFCLLRGRLKHWPAADDTNTYDNWTVDVRQPSYTSSSH
jgi:hypothetical protein